MTKVVDLADYKSKVGQAPEQQRAVGTKPPKPPKKRRHRLRKGLLFTVVCVLGIYLLLHSQLFCVKTIEVTGNSIVSSEKIIELSEISAGERLYAVNIKDSAKKIGYYPYVEAVEVKRKLPDRILIEIVERKPVGAVVTTSGYIQVSMDGRLLSIAPTIGQYNLPVISGVQISEVPTPGNIIQNDNLTKALQIISECDQDLLNNLAELNVGQADSIMACTNEGIEIRLGDVDDIEIRLMDLNDILKDIVMQKIRAEDIEYIDMRYLDAPVIKLKEVAPKN